MATVIVKTATRRNDAVTVNGTVDDVAYTVNVWMSHLDTFGTKDTKRRYAAEQLKAAADREVTQNVDITGTVEVS